jgi:hypothetical protein
MEHVHKDGMKRKIAAKIAPFILMMVLIFSVYGCKSDGDIPDVSHLNGDFELIRTEQILFQLDTLASEEEINQGFAAHQIFWDIYFNQVMPAPEDSSVSWQTLRYDPYLQAISDSVVTVFTSVDDVRNQFASAFQYLQYYFPGNRVPRVFTLISGFGFFPFIFEDGDRDGLGVSLEMFLGADFPYRTFTGQDPAFSDYLVRSYNRDHLVKRSMDVVVDDLAGPPAGDRLLDLMLHNGLKLYILEHLMPHAPDSVIFEFTPDQIAWCEANERSLWAHFLKDDLLYATEFHKIQKLIAPAPLIGGMPAEAPGGVANWTAWRIFHALAKRNPALKLTDLIALKDAQTILEMARYRPQ